MCTALGIANRATHGIKEVTSTADLIHRPETTTAHWIEHITQVAEL